MKITAANLRAIEEAVGHNAKAFVAVDDHRFYGPAAALVVEAEVDGRKCYTRLEVMLDAPAVHVCRQVVSSMQAHIREEVFSKCRWED